MKTVCVFTLGLCMAAGNVLGADRSKKDFDAIDQNQDGQLSWQEFEGRIMESFYFSDLDSDGQLTREEASPWLLRNWSEINQDGDNSINNEEFGQYHRRKFLDADQDSNSTLSRTELDNSRPHESKRHRRQKNAENF